MVVSAYIDGKSRFIERMKLDAVGRFERAQRASGISVVVDGERHSRSADLVRFAGFGLAPAVGVTALGFMLADSVGALVGGVIGAAAFAVPACFFLHRALGAPGWEAGSRYVVNGGSTPSVRQGASRLRALVDSQAGSERHFLFLSGHGNQREIASIPVAELGEAMRGCALSATVLDACLVGQLEVLAHLSPWAGYVLASPHPVKARGMEVEAMFSSQSVNEPDLEKAVVGMAREARSTTPSLSVVDTGALASRLLPALDELGRRLAGVDVRGVLARSLSPEWFGSRVDLGSFLAELEAEGVDVAKAREAFAETVRFQKNEHSLTFDLRSRDGCLPEGWRGFLEAVDRRFKPWF